MTALDRLLQAAACNRFGRREFLRRAAALGIGSGLAASLASKSAYAQTPQRGGHLTVGLDGASASDSLDPATYTASYMMITGCLFYNQLCEVDEHVALQPSLAESWEPRAGAAEWVFKLRRGVMFHNGKEMTAADVVYSINHHRGETSKSATKALLAPVTELVASDKYELTIKLNGPYVDLPFILSDYHLGIAPEGDAFDRGIGTGPFIVENFDPGVRTMGKRNPNHFDPQRGFVDSVEMLAINDATARVTALASGSVQMINRVIPTIVDRVKSAPGVSVFSIAGGGHNCFPMRCDMAPFDNPDLRLAMKYAIDRDSIVKTILRGHGKIGNDEPIPSYDPDYASDIAQRPYDPDKAKFHWQKSGYSGPIQLSVSDTAFSGAVDAATLFQTHAAKAGIKIDVVREPADGYWSDVWMKKPFCASYWDGRPTAGLMFSLAYKSDAPWNEAYWQRPAFDKLLLAARAEIDPAKRKEIYHDMQAMVTDDGGELIPMFNNFNEGVADNVKGFVQTPNLQLSGYRAPCKVWLES